MRRNEREGAKGEGRNTERRRKGDRMDERDMEEERKDGETEWGIERKMLFLDVFSFLPFGIVFYF
jgi:hypothetical protein